MRRPAPPLTERSGEFWRSGADGRLRIARCRPCGFYMHPPGPVCSRCRSPEVGFEPVSGRGVVYSFTINRYPWNPGMPPPYVIAEIELLEQPGLRMLSNLIDVEPDAVAIGMPVHVVFDRADDTWIPVFRP